MEIVNYTHTYLDKAIEFSREKSLDITGTEGKNWSRLERLLTFVDETANMKVKIWGEFYPAYIIDLFVSAAIALIAKEK